MAAVLLVAATLTSCGGAGGGGGSSSGGTTADEVWHRDGANPLITPRLTSTTRSFTAADPCVLRDPDTGAWRAWFSTGLEDIASGAVAMSSCELRGGESNGRVGVREGVHHGGLGIAAGRRRDLGEELDSTRCRRVLDLRRQLAFTSGPVGAGETQRRGGDDRERRSAVSAVHDATVAHGPWD